MKIRVNDLALDTLGYLFVVQYFCWVNGSEFPERECCDTILSSPPNPEPIQPTRPSITRKFVLILNILQTIYMPNVEEKCRPCFESASNFFFLIWSN